MNDLVEALTPRAKKPADFSFRKSDFDIYQQLIDAALDVICTIDSMGRFVTVSAAAKALWGYTPEELQGKPYLNFVLDADKAITLKAAADIMAGVKMTHFENRYTCKDGSIKPILWFSGWDKATNTMYCVAKDASQIRQVERRLHRAYKLSAIAWWEYDVATTTYTISDEIVEMFGLPNSQTKKLSLEEFLSLVHPDDQSKLAHDLSTLCQDTYFNYEHRLIKPSGEVIYLIHFSEVERDKIGNPIKVHGSSKDITHRKLNQIRLEESEQALQQYAQRLTGILESLGDGFFTLDKDWNITYWNNKAEKLTGKDKESIIGKNIWDEFEGARELKAYTEYHRAVAENRSVHFEEYYQSVSTWFEINAYPSREGLSVFFKNINERKQQEKELQISNERFGFVSKATSDVVWDWNLETGEIYINQSFTRIFGHPVNTGMPFSQLWRTNLHPDDQERVICSQNAVLKNPDASFWEDNYRFIKSDGEVAYVTDRAIIVRDSEGKALRMIGAVQDSTEKRKQEKRLEFIAKASSVVIWERTCGSEEVAINREKFNQLFGYKLCSNHIHRSFWFDKIHPDDVAGMDANREQALSLGRDSYKNEYRFKKADGTWAYVKDRTYILTNDEGKPVSLLGAMEDVTKKRLSEKALMESEHSYRQLYNCSPLPAIVIDNETLKILDVNTKAVKHYGYSREDFLQLNFTAVRHSEKRLRVADQVSKGRKKSNSQVETQIHLKKGGEPILVEVSITSIHFRGNKAMLAMVNDITEQARLQEQLIQEKVNQQKSITKAAIEAQEQERSEIGKELHDNVCQLLATAKLFLKSVPCYPGQGGHFLDKSTLLLQNAMDEIRKLSKTLVTPAFHEVPFTYTLTELLESYNELNLFTVNFCFDFDEQLIEKGLRLTIYRIIQEQLNNAVKYAQASTVSVSIRCIKNTLQVHYQDNGVGFDLATVKKGLGLNNIKNRADAYKGRLQVKTGIGKGCQMRLNFAIDKQRSPNL